MESYKLRFLDSYIKRMRCDSSLEELASSATNWIRCKLHEDEDNMNDLEFLKMMLLDGAVVVEVLLIRSDLRSIEMNKSLEIVLNLTKGIEEDFKHDMMLMENQLPFRFICDLLSFLSKPISFYQLLWDNFNFGLTLKEAIPNELFIHSGYHNFVEIIRGMIKGMDLNFNYYGKYIQICCATQLLEAGVKFKRAEVHCFIQDIKFSDGELLMPSFPINDHTETIFRNIISFESCSKKDNYICSYVMLMHSLLDTVKDVDLLVEKGIIVNHLGRNENVLELFNSLSNIKEAKYGKISDRFYFNHTCKDLNRYRKSIWHQWKGAIFKWKIILMRDYFSNPFGYCGNHLATPNYHSNYMLNPFIVSYKT